MKTLATEFNALREKQALSLKDLAERSGLKQASPWKVENGKTVKGATLHTLIVNGLGYATSSKEYQGLVALWAESHGLIVDHRAKLKATAQGKSIDSAVSDCTAREIKALERALSTPDSRAALIALAKHFT